MPPSNPATRYPCRAPTNIRATNPEKLIPEKNSTKIHSSRGLMPPSGPYGPCGSRGNTTMAITANRMPGADRDVVHPVDDGVHAGLLDEQQRRDRHRRARQVEAPDPGEDAGRDGHQRGHLRGAANFAPRRRRVGDDHEGDAAGGQHGRERRQPGRPQPPAQPRVSAEQRERAHAREVHACAVRVAGPLPLDADGGAAQRRDNHACGPELEVGHDILRRARGCPRQRASRTIVVDSTAHRVCASLDRS